MSKSNPKKILFLMSGSIAAFKACQLLSRLVQDGHEVQVVATPSTFEFIGSATLEGLTGKKPLSDLWERGRAMDHIHLTRWADMAVLCPASANTLARLAHGLAEEMVSAMALAWEPNKPLWIFPAMNHQMLQAEPTRANLERLAARGFRVAPTQAGNLACGEEGFGRLLEPEAILQMLLGPPLGKVLVTGGATREPIDGIRFLSNVSTGRTASALCQSLSARGWDVTYLHGTQAILPAGGLRRQGFGSFSDLDEKLRAELGGAEYAAVIHSAAVSDYSPLSPQTDVKLASQPELRLDLKANFKILPRLREYSRHKNIRVIGFKLTLNADPIPAAEKMLTAHIDAVVANEWQSLNADRSRHPGCVVTAQGQTRFEDLTQLSEILHALIAGGTNDSVS